jgi:transcriptional regulator with XRE-family HTH domain
MAYDQGPVVQSALLRNELTRLRKENNLTQEQVARSLDWSPSKLIRIEGGKSSVTKTDLQALLLHYDVTSATRQSRLQEWARGAREPGWWSVYKGEIAETYYQYIGYEAGAFFMRRFQGAVVPGSLQTEDYAEVLTADSVAPVRVAPVVKIRMQRQRELAKREERPWQFYVLDEAVIRRHVGIQRDPAIMPNQLRHIVDMVEQHERISVQVIPFSAGAHRGLNGPFTVLEFEGDLADVLYLEGGRSASILITGDDPRIAEYRDWFEVLTTEALSVDKSLQLIRDVAEELMS